MFNKRLITAGLAALLIGGLGACGGGSGGGGDGTGSAAGVSRSSGTTGQAQPTPETVTGLREAVRHLAKKTARGTRPHLVAKCSSATREVRHTSSTGTGSRKKTRTWYSTDRYRKCTKVHSGTETYTRVVRREQWCVSLDDVGGDTAKDDVWYQVTRATYDEALGTDEHARMEFTPAATGC